MSKSLTPKLLVNLSSAETADFLSKELGGKPSHWAIWLANDRRPNRVNRRLPQEPGPGRPRYNAAMVEAFAIGYKRDHLQPSQAGVQAKPSKNRRFSPHVSALTLAEGAEQPGVLFVIPKPLMSFILSAEEARSLAARLTKAANELEEEGSEQVVE